jgi:hypothetical protein
MGEFNVQDEMMEANQTGHYAFSVMLLRPAPGLQRIDCCDMFLIVSLGASCWSLGWSGSFFGTYSEDICGMH